jgi:hypothetical protein
MASAMPRSKLSPIKMNALLSTPEIGPPLIQKAPFPAMADSHHPKPGPPQSQTSSTLPALTFWRMALSVMIAR